MYFELHNYNSVTRSERVVRVAAFYYLNYFNYHQRRRAAPRAPAAPAQHQPMHSLAQAEGQTAKSRKRPRQQTPRRPPVVPILTRGAGLMGRALSLILH